MDQSGQEPTVKGRIVGDLHEFLHWLLKEKNFVFGTSEFLSAQALACRLHERGYGFDNTEELKLLLAPVLVSSPAEQDEFYRCFDEWGKRYESQEKVPLGPDGIGGPDGPEERWWKDLMSRKAIVLAIIAAVLWFAFQGVFLGKGAPGQGGKPEVEDTPVNSPGTGVPAPLPTPVAPLAWWATWQGMVGIAGVCLLPLTGWWLHRLRNRSDLYLRQYEGFRALMTPRSIPLTCTGATDQRLMHYARIAQKLRRRTLAGRRLCVRGTVLRSISNGGFLSLVYRARTAAPEYIALVERCGKSDIATMLYREMIEGLRKADVPVTLYYMGQDPRLCTPEDKTRPPLRLVDLVTLHPGHNALIFSSGNGFFDRATGTLADWTSLFEGWEYRALLTPKPAEHWGAMEKDLARLFVVAEADGKGLENVALRFRENAPALEQPEPQRPLAPEELTLEKEIWRGQVEPPAASIRSMLRRLRAHLGEPAYLWLQACSVYPALHWNLTLRLGMVLKDKDGSEEPVLTSRRLADLSSLVWFRHGRIPNWLRRWLVYEMPEQNERRVRSAVEEIFKGAKQEQAGIELSTPVSTWQHLKSLLRRSESPEPTDAVFLDTVSGRSLDRLAFHVNRYLRDKLLPATEGFAVGTMRSVKAAGDRLAALSQSPREVGMKVLRFLVIGQPGQADRKALRVPKRRFMVEWIVLTVGVTALSFTARSLDIGSGGIVLGIFCEAVFGILAWRGLRIPLLAWMAPFLLDVVVMAASWDPHQFAIWLPIAKLGVGYFAMVRFLPKCALWSILHYALTLALTAFQEPVASSLGYWPSSMVTAGAPLLLDLALIYWAWPQGRISQEFGGFWRRLLFTGNPAARESALFPSVRYWWLLAMLASGGALSGSLFFLRMIYEFIGENVPGISSEVARLLAFSLCLLLVFLWYGLVFYRKLGIALWRWYAPGLLMNVFLDYGYNFVFRLMAIDDDFYGNALAALVCNVGYGLISWVVLRKFMPRVVEWAVWQSALMFSLSFIMHEGDGVLVTMFGVGYAFITWCLIERWRYFPVKTSGGNPSRSLAKYVEVSVAGLGDNSRSGFIWIWVSTVMLSAIVIIFLAMAFSWQVTNVPYLYLPAAVLIVLMLPGRLLGKVFGLPMILWLLPWIFGISFYVMESFMEGAGPISLFRHTSEKWLPAFNHTFIEALVIGVSFMGLRLYRLWKKIPCCFAWGLGHVLWFTLWNALNFTVGDDHLHLKLIYPAVTYLIITIALIATTWPVKLGKDADAGSAADSDSGRHENQAETYPA